ncbi:hypothetical protein AY601_1638 [Pedobacter cryoconitis]|uniref:Uncharacterized protein n=1 Tax=Pedobacter cryoconitis TaxID=188932 RepID=A0A127VB33_9SPHI|nr:hypothetical protein [Pedobacter cryoconitis]AMP98553.1 hypothetical protein AY601_1638 [Pedobacter cryoconitis]
MKTLTLFILFMYGSHSYPEITELRTLYYESANDKAAAGKLLDLLSNVDDQSSQLLICYKGVAEMMQAKYTMSPISKFRRFKKGKEYIESAVAIDPENLEIRFLRFTIQTNLPSFLGYNDHIIADKTILIKNLDQIHDKPFKQLVINYLFASKNMTEKERNSIKK